MKGLRRSILPLLGFEAGENMKSVERETWKESEIETLRETGTRTRLRNRVIKKDI